MKNSSDPSVHRERERQLIEHVQRLLDDDRLRIDTTGVRRPVTAFTREVSRGDRSVDLKRLMSEVGATDRELESRMPVGELLDVVLSQKRWLLFKQTVGRLRVLCISPARELLRGETPRPMDLAAVKKALAEVPPPLGGVPSTVVLMSTSGFRIEAHEMAERRADRTVILVEPNDAGGWSVAGPTETKALADLFDPEGEQEKRQRIRAAIDDSRVELLGSGIATDRLANRLQLPLQLVEDELKSYARQNAGLAARRLDGRVVLFRDGAAAAGAGAAGGSDMPFLERMRSLFSRKGENEKKIAFLAERRAALSQQRDRAYEDVATLEEKEADLRRQFQQSSSAIAKRRLTSQLLQFRKDIERRQQLLGVLNQQITVVSTHLHNLELVQQGQAARLPDSEQLTADAAAAEEMLARLEADHELAGTVGTMAHTGLTAEEQALYEELEREAGGESATKIELDTVEPEPTAPPRREPAQPQRAEPERTPPRRRPSEPEAG